MDEERAAKNSGANGPSGALRVVFATMPTHTHTLRKKKVVVVAETKTREFVASAGAAASHANSSRQFVFLEPTAFSFIGSFSRCSIALWFHSFPLSLSIFGLPLCKQAGLPHATRIEWHSFRRLFSHFLILYGL